MLTGLMDPLCLGQSHFSLGDILAGHQSLVRRVLHGWSRAWVINSMLVVLALAAAGSVAAAFQPPPGNPVPYVPPPAPPAVTRAPLDVYFIGDSVTGGAAGGGRENERYGNVMSARLNWIVTTDAVGATGFVAKGPQQSQVDATFGTRVQKIIAANPDIVIVAGGRNDSYAPIEDFTPKASEFFTQLRAGLPNTKIVTLAGWRWNTTDEVKAVKAQAALAQILEAETARVGGMFIDPVKELPMFEDSNAAQYITDDKFHPNAAGYRVLGEALARVMHAKGFPLGPEIWKESGVVTGEFNDTVGAFFQ